MNKAEFLKESIERLQNAATPESIKNILILILLDSEYLSKESVIDLLKEELKEEEKQ